MARRRRKRERIRIHEALEWVRVYPEARAIRNWHAEQFRTRGKCHVYGSGKVGIYKVKEPNWGWPPVPGAPCVGWRYRLVAAGWRRVWMRRYGWVPKKAHIILLGWERGTVRGLVGDFRYLLTEWERMRVRKLERQHRRPMQVNFLARTVSFR